MAITKIHAIKSTLRKAIAYIENPEKTDGQLLVSGYNVDPQMASVDFEMTASLARHVHHTGKHIKFFLECFQRWICGSSLAPDGSYELPGIQERISLPHQDNTQGNFQEILSRYPDYEKARTTPKIQSNRTELRSRLRFILRRACTYGEFVQMAAALGISVDNTEKHIKFRMDGAERWTRGKTLSDQGLYEAPAIRDQLERNQGSLPFLRQAIKKAAQQASSLDEYLALLSEQGIDAKENATALAICEIHKEPYYLIL